MINNKINTVTNKINTVENKKIISFDVGIINLAYCIMEYDGDYLKIIKWDVINLLNLTTDEKECSAPMLNDKCENSVKYEINAGLSKYFLCTKHKKYADILKMKNDEKNNKMIYDKLSSKKSENKNTCYHSVNDVKCNKSGIHNLDNIIYCSTHYKQLISKNNKFEILNIKTKSTKDLSTDELKFNLITKLDEIKNYILNVDEVLIENQPTFKNPKMKGLSDTIYSWFMIRGISDKIINKSTINKIMFICPSNKLKDFVVQEQIDVQETDRDKYKVTKKLGIQCCLSLLNQFKLENWKTHFLEYSKKDDMADCFLQGWYYFNKTEITKKTKNINKNNKNNKNDNDNNNIINI
jgi:hypothetical protein